MKLKVKYEHLIEIIAFQHAFSAGGCRKSYSIIVGVNISIKREVSSFKIPGSKEYIPSQKASFVSSLEVSFADIPKCSENQCVQGMIGDS